MQENQGRKAVRPVNPAREYMQEYLEIVRQIRSLIRTRDRHLRDMGRYEAAWGRATKATSRLKAVSISGTPMHDGMANAVLDIIRYEEAARRGAENADGVTERLRFKIDRLTEALTVRLALIDRLSDARYKTVILMRYIEGAEWRVIAREEHYELRRVYELHGEALEEIRKMMSERVQ